jgi:site-specific DNA-methyltransferase (adenine-specific)
MGERLVLTGDCRAHLAAMETASVDAAVTDPPYELAFMGKKWDASGIAYDVDLWRAMLRVLKPGGHLVAFGGTRTSHRMVCAIEDAGFEVRDSLVWMYGSGFPKSLDMWDALSPFYLGRSAPPEWSELANRYDGWGTALKPAHEPICLARKPLTGTVAANVTEHGTGALNVDGCRVGTDGGGTHCTNRDANGKCLGHRNAGQSTSGETFHGPDTDGGRWPPNVLLDDEAAAMVDEQSGELSNGGTNQNKKPGCGVCYGAETAGIPTRFAGDTGGASRFFPRFNYCAKASTAEREAGLDGFALGIINEQTPPGTLGSNSPRAGAGRRGGRRNTHPTVKPVDLIRWLVRLVTPPGGLVLDPFCGSGTTGMACALEGFRFVGIELDEQHAEIARARIRYAEQRRGRPLIAEKAAPVDKRQLGLFGGTDG